MVGALGKAVMRAVVGEDWQDLLGVVQQRAHMWLPDRATSPVQVSLVRIVRRPGSRMLVVDLSADRSLAQRVIVKVPLAPNYAQDPTSQWRPSLLPPTDPSVKHLYQHAAMVAARRHFDALNDPSLGVNRVLDHIPEHRALVLDYVEQPTVGELLRSRRMQVRGRHPHVSLGTACQTAGRWLRHFHDGHLETSLDQQPPALRATPEDLLESLVVRARYIIGLGGANTQLASIVRALERAHERGEPRPSLSLYHGDFAPRNMFLGADGAVTVFDINGRWTAPVFEDVAYFLTALSASRLQVLTQGKAARHQDLRTYEQAFLSGYFGNEPVPAALLAPYRALLLLDRWAALLWRWTYHPYTAHPLGRALRGLTNRYFSHAMYALSSDLDAT